MREALFVKQNREKWQSFETPGLRDADVLAEQYIEITNDLAYAKTFYPNSKTTAYLNGLATKLHQSVYVNKKEKSNRIISFWRSELPLLFFEHRKKLAYSFIFFMLAFLIGYVSAKYDDTFIRLILGDSYVNTTNENIAKGDPFGIFKQDNQVLMFVQIASNNIYVAFRAFVMGVIVSLGTVVMMLYNGVMLGSFQYYFISHGLGIKFILVVFIHGTLEISAIIIAGGAGLVMGNSILFPKTYSRLLSFKKGAKDGMKIVLGLVPVFLVAACFESFVTRYTEMPLWLSLVILVGSATFIGWYVVIYPRRLNIRINLANAAQH